MIITLRSDIYHKISGGVVCNCVEENTNWLDPMCYGSMCLTGCVVLPCCIGAYCMAPHATSQHDTATQQECETICCAKPVGTAYGYQYGELKAHCPKSNRLGCCGQWIS